MFNWLKNLINRETAAQRRARERMEAEKKRDEVRMERYAASVGARGISARPGGGGVGTSPRRTDSGDDSLSPTNIAVAAAIYSSMSSGSSYGGDGGSGDSGGGDGGGGGGGD